MRHARIIGTALACVALTGCGASDSGKSDTETANTATPTTNAAPAPNPADDDIAASALLKLSDLPSDWTATDEKGGDSEQSKCAGIRDARGAVSARDSSPTFDHRPTGQVTHTIYLYSDESKASDAYSKLAAPGTRQCLGDSVKELAMQHGGSSAKIGDVQTGELRMDPIGDDSSAARITLDYSAKGFDLTLTDDIIYIRKGRGLSLITLGDESGDFDSQLRDDLIKIAYRRIRNALKSDAPQ